MSQTLLMRVERRVYCDVKGLGERIKKARKADSRPLTKLAAEADMSVPNWYAIENEEVKALPEETLRKMENVLGKDFGVRFDDLDRS